MRVLSEELKRKLELEILFPSSDEEECPSPAWKRAKMELDQEGDNPHPRASVYNRDPAPKNTAPQRSTRPSKPTQKAVERIFARPVTAQDRSIQNCGSCSSQISPSTPTGPDPQPSRTRTASGKQTHR
jgi:hypothetical protein